jgi:D-threo-aldose 1-dehydrogenase
LKTSAANRAALGWANLGGYACPEPPTHALQAAVFEMAEEWGITTHDTAVDYGRGFAEEGLGLAMAGSKANRASLRIQSKVLRQIVRDPSAIAYREKDLWRCPLPYQNWSTTWDWSYQGVLRQAAESRERLQVPYHDGLALHDPAEAVRQAGMRLGDLDTTALAALRDLKEHGQLRTIGIGTKEIPIVLELLDHYPTLFDYLMIMNYNLLDHEQAIDDLIPRCAEMGIELFSAGPYASGILAAPLDSSGPFYYRTPPAQILAKVRVLRDLAHEFGLSSLKPVAVGFVAAQPAFTKIVFGGRSPEELRENFSYMNAAVPAPFWKRLRQVEVDGKLLIHPNAPLPYE